MPKKADLTFEFADKTVEITSAEAEQELLEGANAAVAVRNGESAETVLTWLRYHIEHHGLNGAVIFDRAEPGSDRASANRLKAG